MTSILWELLKMEVLLQWAQTLTQHNEDLSTFLPSGFPEHRKRCLLSCLRVYDTLTEYVQVQIFGI